MIVASHPCRAAERAFEVKGASPRRVELPTLLHRPFLRVRFGRPTVPALEVDGERVSGSGAIMRRLDELVPDPPLFPADPEARARVEEAERWGDEVLQEAARRIELALLRRHPESVAEQARESTLPLAVPASRVLAGPGARLAARLYGASDERARADLRELPGHLDRVDAWIAEGVLGGEAPNAADLQIGASVRLLSTADDLAPLLEGRPALDLARRLYPRYAGLAPAGTLPAGWLPEAEPATA